MINERSIENDLIEKLRDLKYIYRDDIRDRAALERNFREKFDALNRVELTDAEFARILETIVTPDAYEAAKTLRGTTSIDRDDGTPLHFNLVNIDDWCKNDFEVVNQLRVNTETSHHRYDVILLINGVPVVQIELKTLEISPRRAMQQIVDYKNDPGNGYGRTLLCFTQIFIVSNRSNTWYFANNNERHFRFDVNESFLPVYRMATEDNRKIVKLDEFSEAFLRKCELAQMIGRYMVLVATERRIVMMRPYQVYAVRAIVDCIERGRGNGYIWHTTGSGKTLTSFKASTLLKDDPNVDKCLFVVDRKDLDRQTREEFNRFQPDCVEENTNTETLVRRLLSEDKADKVIVTTIQKLGLALGGHASRGYKERLEPLRDKRMVFIFDECHRSQFGRNHRAIKEFFPNSRLFGFTGTPIFPENANQHRREGDEGSHFTTEDLFERCLHEYTITHAIEDGNVLKFHIEHFRQDGAARARSDAATKAKIVEKILEKHDALTAQRKFNALFATASINDAIDYVEIFRAAQESRREKDPEYVALNVACVFSPPAENNPDVKQLQDDLPTEKADNTVEPEKKKAALRAIIEDYNARYGTNHALGEFDAYYQDVQKRIKDQQYSNEDLTRAQKIDVTIVVDMLLTGFDAKYLNTLYVDKNLKYHGLIQAFSRTNRVLNGTKPHGAIVDFRSQEAAVEQAIERFSGLGGERAKQIWLVDEAPMLIERFGEAKRDLEEFMTSQGVACRPEEVANLRGDIANARFVTLFKEMQRLKVQLDQYTDLTPDQRSRIENIAPDEAMRGFRGMYLETAKRLRAAEGRTDDKRAAAESVAQLDFEYVLFASTLVDYDYIMGLLSRTSGEKPEVQKATREQLIGLIQADAKFADERETIAEYIRGLSIGKKIDEKTLRVEYEEFKRRRDAEELTTLAERHGLPVDALHAFAAEVLRRRVFDGERLRELLATLDLGWKARTAKELAFMTEFAPYLRRLADDREISGLAVYE